MATGLVIPMMEVSQKTQLAQAIVREVVVGRDMGEAMEGVRVVARVVVEGVGVVVGNKDCTLTPKVKSRDNKTLPYMYQLQQVQFGSCLPIPLKHANTVTQQNLPFQTLIPSLICMSYPFLAGVEFRGQSSWFTTLKGQLRPVEKAPWDCCFLGESINERWSKIFSIL